MTEETMLNGCLENNSAAQEALYNHLSPKMLGVCYRFAKNREDAEDMLQEGFIKVFAQIHQYRNEGALEGWIRRIVVHTCINTLKKNKKFSDSVDISYAGGVGIREENIPSIMQAKQVVECIRILPVGYRTGRTVRRIYLGGPQYRGWVQWPAGVCSRSKYRGE